MNSGLYTTTAYKHLQLRTRRQNNPPDLLIGPPLPHKTRDASLFRYMSSCMARICPDVKNILAVESNKDRALFRGFLQAFPNPTHVLCKKHFEDDIQRKLTSL